MIERERERKKERWKIDWQMIDTQRNNKQTYTEKKQTDRHIVMGLQTINKVKNNSQTDKWMD